MSFKEELDAALAAYDEAKEQRNTATGEERSELDAKLTELAEEVRSASARVDEETKIEEVRAKSPLAVARPTIQVRERDNDNAELRSLITRAGARGNFEVRAVLGDATKNFANTGFGLSVIRAVEDNMTLTQAGATFKPDTTGNPIAATVVDPIDVDRTARDSALPVTTADSERTLSSYLYGGIVKIDNAHINDSAFDLVGEISNKAGVFVGNELAVDLVGGDGSAKPYGLLNATYGASAGATAPATALTAGALTKLVAKVKSRNAVWIMNSDTYAAIWNLDTNGMWSFNPQENVTTLLGRAVVIDETMPDIEASAKSVILGDFVNGYYLRVVGGVETQTLVELYAEKNQTGVKVTLRADGVVTDPNLVKYIQHAAS